jgi:hypothetical protein
VPYRLLSVSFVKEAFERGKIVSAAHLKRVCSPLQTDAKRVCAYQVHYIDSEFEFYFKPKSIQQCLVLYTLALLMDWTAAKERK